MGFNYTNKQMTQMGGRKMTRKVIIKNGKGHKSVCSYKNGTKCNYKKKNLTKGEIQLIQIGKFIPGLFNNVNVTPKH